MLCVFDSEAGGTSADTRQSSSQLPSNAQVIGYLLNWYRHASAERQVASDPADLLFLHDNQAIEEQIVKLSFEYAKADVTLETTASSPNKAPATPAPADPPDLAHLIELKNRSDQVSQKAIRKIDTLNQKLAVARMANRKNLNAALDDAQSRLDLAHAVSQTVNGLIEFVQSIGTSQAHWFSYPQPLVRGERWQKIPHSRASRMARLRAAGRAGGVHPCIGMGLS